MTESETTHAKLPGVYGHVVENPIERRHLKLAQVGRTASCSGYGIACAAPAVHALAPGPWIVCLLRGARGKALVANGVRLLQIGSEDGAYREHGSFENEAGGLADSDGTPGTTREIGSDAQLNSVVTVVQVNQDVGQKSEDGLSSSLKSDGVYGVDVFHKSQLAEGADPSLKTELDGRADPVLESELIKIEDHPLKREPVELKHAFHERKAIELEDPSPLSGPFEVEGSSPWNEPIRTLDPSVNNEAVKIVDPSSKNETAQAEAEGLISTSEPIQDANPTINNEASEAVDPSSNEAVEEVDFLSEIETPKVVDPSPSEAAEVVGPLANLEAVEALDSSRYEAKEAVDPSSDEDVEVVDPLPKEAVEVVDPSSKEAVEAVDPSPNEATEVVDPSSNEAVEGRDPSPNDAIEEVDLSTDEAVEAEAPSPKTEAVEAVDRVLVSDPMEDTSPASSHESTEFVDTTVNNEIEDIVEPSLKSQSFQSETPLPGTQADQSPDASDGPSVGPDTVFAEDASALTSDEPCIGNLSRPAHAEATELVGGTLHLEGESEDKDHGNDAPASEREISDVNDDYDGGIGSSSQEAVPLPTGELETEKSFPSDAEKSEETGVALGEGPSLKDTVPERAERLEQEVKNEGTGEETKESEEEEDASSKAGDYRDLFAQNTPPTQAQEEPTNEGSSLTFEEPAKPQEADSHEDLDRAEEDTGIDHVTPVKTEPQAQKTAPGVEDKTSVGPIVDILSYSQREWKSNTEKSVLIRKGYSKLSESFEGLRRVRGDNYCALRATLFQVLSHSDKLPAWIEDDDITMLPEKLAVEMEPVQSWKFPSELHKAEGTGGAVEQLKQHLKLLQKTWQAVVEAGSGEERQSLCDVIFQGGEEEHGLLEAVKLLMLNSAVELHGHMETDQEVPEYCWLLFARDDSGSPSAFLTNHLTHIGFGGGLEQVEMFLLGYTLQHTIQVHRLYKADTEEFISYYPDDHQDDWPQVCLVTEDDRHYNVLVEKLKEKDFPEASP
ncbi:hypothetical protein GJAV_G00070880 [Gymnothorax javanicus]|nr:hypothetical protein GJAV_G00070880 [Gymnothorax javanicus]